MTEYTKPVPVPSVEALPFWEACRRHELLVPKCNKCGHHWFPPSNLCPECLGEDWAWVRATGQGKVHTFGVYHRVYHQGFQNETPYVLAVVELEEGPRLVSNVVQCAPAEVRCDMPVSVVFEDVTPEATLYKFEPRIGK